jgi:nucleotide-binding universal stress UspA family protein
VCSGAETLATGMLNNPLEVKMNDFRRILFPVDFSRRCERTVPFVREIVQTYRSALALLHVVEIPLYSYGMIPAEGAMLQDSFEENFRTAWQNLTNFACEHFGDLQKNHEIQALCDRGDPGYAILSHAERFAADLIMMPTHGEGPFRSFLVGSATTRVLHRAHCAVWTAAHLDTEFSRASLAIHRILCALDLEHESADVLDCAASLARKYSAHVRIVHCVPVPESGPSEDFLSEFDRFLAATANQKLAKLQSDAGTSYDVVLEGGHISKVVRDAATHQGSDLVVIGRGHTHSALSRLRSNAYAIVREAPCPVLSL